MNKKEGSEQKLERKIVLATFGERACAEIILQIYMVTIIILMSITMAFELFYYTVILFFLLFIESISSFKGRGIGKLLIGLKVVSYGTYSNVSFGKMWYRNFIKGKTALISLFEGEMLHDEKSYTTVINLRKSKNLHIYDEVKEEKNNEDDNWRLKL